MNKNIHVMLREREQSSVVDGNESSQHTVDLFSGLRAVREEK